MFHMEQFWQKIKQNWKSAPDLFFFGTLVFLIPFGTRKFIAVLAPYSTEIFNEWTSVFLYATDILVILVIVFWLRRLVKFHPTFKKHGTIINMLVLVFVLFVAVSAILSPFWELGVYGMLKFIEFGLIFLYAIYNIVTIRRRVVTSVLIFGSASIQAVIGIAQFISQKSLGLEFIGESPLGTHIQNVAEIMFAGQPVLRAYGTFPHPNVLGYFMTISLFMGIYLFVKIKYSYFRLAVTFLAGLQFLALLLSFSRVAWLAAAIGLIVFLAIILVLKIREGKQAQLRIFHLSSIQRSGLITSVVIFLVMVIGSIIVLAPLISGRASAGDIEGDLSHSLRQYLNSRAEIMINERPVTGWGAKSFVPMLAATTSRSEVPFWMLQPVHNGWLGLLTEIGLWGFAVFIVILVWRFFGNLSILFLPKNVPRGTLNEGNRDWLFKTVVVTCLVASVVVMFWDHYILDVQQGGLMYWLLLGL